MRELDGESGVRGVRDIVALELGSAERSDGDVVVLDESAFIIGDLERVSRKLRRRAELHAVGRRGRRDEGDGQRVPRPVVLEDDGDAAGDRLDGDIVARGELLADLDGLDLVAHGLVGDLSAAVRSGVVVIEVDVIGLRAVDGLIAVRDGVDGELSHGHIAGRALGELHIEVTGQPRVSDARERMIARGRVLPLPFVGVGVVRGYVYDPGGPVADIDAAAEDILEAVALHHVVAPYLQSDRGGAVELGVSLGAVKRDGEGRLRDLEGDGEREGVVDRGDSAGRGERVAPHREVAAARIDERGERLAVRKDEPAAAHYVAKLLAAVLTEVGAAERGLQRHAAEHAGAEIPVDVITIVNIAVNRVLPRVLPAYRGKEVDVPLVDRVVGCADLFCDEVLVRRIVEVEGILVAPRIHGSGALAFGALPLDDGVDILERGACERTRDIVLRLNADHAGRRLAVVGLAVEHIRGDELAVGEHQTEVAPEAADIARLIEHERDIAIARDIAARSGYALEPPGDEAGIGAGGAASRMRVDERLRARSLGVLVDLIRHEPAGDAGVEVAARGTGAGGDHDVLPALEGGGIGAVHTVAAQRGLILYVPERAVAEPLEISRIRLVRREVDRIGRRVDEDISSKLALPAWSSVMT